MLRRLTTLSRKATSSRAPIVQTSKRFYLDDDAKLETLALHAGYVPDETTACAVPIHRTSSFVFKSASHARNLFALQELGNIYSRLTNPTNGALEARVSMMEGGHPMSGLAISSGTSAVFYAIINLAAAGDHIVSARNLYGGTYTMFNDILKDFGITCTFVDTNDPAAIKAAIKPNTRAIFCETVSNPALEVTDLEMVSGIAKDAGLAFVVDSTFSTPYLTKPLAHGANVVVHSLTKWMGGHGNGIGGLVVDGGNFDWKNGNYPLYDNPDTSYGGLRWGHDLPEALAPLAFILRMRTVPLRNLGACLSPDNAWQFMNGIETLPLRMERHCENARAVCDFLKGANGVSWVRYPGHPDDPYYELSKKYLRGTGGAMVVFELNGGRTAGETFIENLKMFRHLANVGDAKSLAIHPASTTHSQLSEEAQRKCGITPGMVRLAVGIEHIDDIKKDLQKALDAANSA